MELIKTLKSKPDNIGKWSWVRWWPIHKSRRLFSWRQMWWCFCIECMSFRSSALNRTCVELFIYIILNIEKTEILTVTWLSFFVGIIFISYSCLFTITVTIWPITPCSTVAWFIVITGAIWNFVGFYCWRRTFKFKRALNLTKGFKLWVYVFAIVFTLFIPYKLNPILMLLINCFKLLKSKCSIFELKILGHIQNFDRKTVVQTESVTKWMNRK